jgi:hypothetical protein
VIVPRQAPTAPQRRDTAAGQRPGRCPLRARKRQRGPARSPLRRGRHHGHEVRGIAGAQVGRSGPQSRDATGTLHALRAEGRLNLRGPEVWQGPKRPAHPQSHIGTQGAPQAPPRGEDAQCRALDRSRARLSLCYRNAYVRRQPQPLFQGLLKRAGLPEIRFHDLRHTCATLLLRQGLNPKYVQELLGHADISLTLNVYSHILPDMGDAAAGAMDAALG